jgi:DNA ligase (NAD+)
MTHPFPVYKEVSELLNINPETAKDISLKQLKPIINLSKSAPGILLDENILEKVEAIYTQRSTKTQAKFKAPAEANATTGRLKIKAVIKPKQVTKDPLMELVIRLNQNHRVADNLSQTDLAKLIEWSDEHYYTPKPDQEQPDLLDDKIYDYTKRVYNQRRLKTNDKKRTLLSISSPSGVGCKPKKERDAKLPIALRSLDNMFLGEGDVDKWKAKQGFAPQYVVSAKMDGTSALYDKGKLYTRGDATMGRDISHLLSYLQLPSVPDNISVRGELVISKDLFNHKYKGKKGSHGTRKVNRNSVAGAISTINHIDPEFLSDLTFAAYEVIDNSVKQQQSPSSAFQMLRDFGFETAFNDAIDSSKLNDDDLSSMYHNLLDTYQYEIDGLVVHTDKPYTREETKNPDYAQAFKEALSCDVAVTEILDIEWNPSQYGYLVPTLIYKPVEVCGVTLERATAHNAKEVVKLGLGPGAKVEVIYWGKVNPRVNKVLEPVEPYLPSVPYIWVNSPKGEPINIKLEEETDTVKVKQVYKFLVEIGAKGVGETTVAKIYEQGHKTVGDFIRLKSSDVSFLGPVASAKLVKSIQDALYAISIPTLMACSKIFGRGLGSKKFSKVIEAYPDFPSERHSRDEYVAIFKSVESFAQKTAELAADGMADFWEFVDNEIPSDVYFSIVENTISKPSGTQNPDVMGKNFYLTGFRDSEITDYITQNGGTMQSGCSKSTDMLIIKDHGVTNKKVEFAQKYGINILSQQEFKSRFFS